MLDQENNFYLKGNQDFKSRQKSIFHALDKLSAELPENRFKNEDLNDKKTCINKNKHDFKQFRGKESIFKRPESVPIRKYMKLKIPEFIKNPHKWKKYSLGNDEISEHSNMVVAMSFLEDLRKRSSETAVENEEISSKPKFNKYNNEKGKDLATEIGPCEKPIFINGKIVMPEYVVGQKMKKEKISKKQPIMSNVSVKLDHLINDE